MQTVNSMLPAIGTRVLVRFESIRVLCTVQDAKSSYGKTRLLVRPVEGAGEQWIEPSGRVSIENGGELL